jgi:hypothetical protein
MDRHEEGLSTLQHESQHRALEKEMNNAKFSRDRFDQCDAKGKKWARSLLEKLGASDITETKSNSKYDIGARTGGKDIKIEVEIKRDWGSKWLVKRDDEGWLVNGTWSGVPFPFEDIRFAARKKDNPVDYYMTFSGCGRYALVALAEDVKKSKVKKIDNKHMSHESFMVFKLSGKNRFVFFELDDGEWVLIHHWDGRFPKVLTLDNVFGEMSDSVLDF